MFLLFMLIWAGSIGCLIAFAIFRSKAKAKSEAKVSPETQRDRVDVAAAMRAVDKSLENSVLGPASSAVHHAAIEKYFEAARRSEVFVRFEPHVESHTSRIAKAYAIDLSKGKQSSGSESMPIIKVLR